MLYKFNSKQFASDLADTRLSKSSRTIRGRKGVRIPLPMSLRDAAGEIGVSAATLNRTELEIASVAPDMKTFLAVCAWMGEGPSKYFVPAHPKK